MGICIISRFAFAGRFTGGGVPVTLSALHYPPHETPWHGHGGILPGALFFTHRLLWNNGSWSANYFYIV